MIDGLMAPVLAQGWTIGLSSAGALSAVALLGYLFGRSQRTEAAPAAEGVSDDVNRAMRIARQLESIADDLRQELALHCNHVSQFKEGLRRADADGGEEAWRRLQQEADGMVAPTLQLVNQLSAAYDRIRQQSQSLANFTGGRTDPLTGLANSRALEEHLDVLLGSGSEGRGQASVVVFSLDATEADRANQESCVRRVGQQLGCGLRGDDFAARYGVDEFVVVLPATPISGASVFANRLRKTLREKQDVAISCGLTESMPADTPKSLLARADSAAYSARAAGGDRQYRHNGGSIREDELVDRPAATAEAETPQDEAPANPPASAVAVALPGPPVMGDLAAPISN